MAPPLAALIPVKAFSDGKSRLETALDARERAALAEKLATAVVSSCAPIPVYVACEDAGVAAWAEALGAKTITSEASGLNRVVRHGVAFLTAAGYERVMVVHSDLADPRNLSLLGGWDGVVLVPDLQLDGTNVLIVETRGSFRFSYGPGSFARHLSEAERLDSPLHIIDDPGLALDLDDPEDLELYSALVASTAEPATPRER